MSAAIGAVVHFDHELAANPEPLVALLATLTSAAGTHRQWHIPEKGKGPPPSPFNLKRLVARVGRGNTWCVGVETPSNTPDADALLVTAGTTPLSKPSRSLTKCRYDAFIGFGSRRTVGVDAIIRFAESVRVRAGAIFVADTTEHVRALATGDGGATLTAEQLDRVTDGLYWRPRWGEVIRGPAWGTFLGASHVEKLGGMTRIEREAGCARVTALSSGGAYLQTTLEPTDAVPEALVRFLEPVSRP